ncbi:MAG: riboflavin biosynthesis protein RibD, partial [Ilumatobacteraceae bacterium]
MSARMQQAIDVAQTARLRTAPNPWVGCVITTADGRTFTGATEPPGQRHAEVVALDAALAAGADLRGADVLVTLEPCIHHGRSGTCVERLVAAGVARVNVALQDPDPRVAGSGLAALRRAGIEVHDGDGADAVHE